MNRIRSDDDAATLAPAFVVAADGKRLIQGDDDLDGVVRVGWDDAGSLADQEEAAVPEVPAGDV